MSELLNTREMASILRVHVKTLSAWASQGTIPAMKLGGRWRFDEAEVREALRPSTDPWRKPVRPLRRRAA